MGWGLFYFTDLQQLATFLRILFALDGVPLLGEQTLSDLQAHSLWIPLALVACTPVAPWLAARALRVRVVCLVAGWRPIVTLAVDVVLLLSCTALLVGQSYNPFLYFRF